MAVPASSGPLPTPPRSVSVRRRTVAAAAATVATAGLVLAGLSGSAQAEGETARPSAAPAPDPGLLKAMSRDLGLTTEQAKTRLANEADAADTVDALRRALGDSYAGAHVSGKTSARLTVATTDERERARITEAGATARVVGRDLGDLDRVLKALDRAAAKSAPEGVRVWYADVERNAVVVETATNAAARKLLGRAGVGGDEVTLRHTDAEPRTFADLRGGDAYYMNGSGRCSIGFSVKRGTQGGFVTAGHCGTVGTSTSGYNQQAQGTFQGSTFPGRDYAWVATNSNWTPRPTVNGYGRGDVTVAGSTQAPVGASVCRSGSTTGWHCGVVEQHNTSVTYPQGTVSGVTRTTVCAEPGDSGGSFISGDQAQGMTSGGSGNCSSGGTTFFYPVNPALQAYGLTLVTNGGGGPTDPPTDPPEQGTWAVGTQYAVGDQVTYNGATYRCVQAHTAQPGWNPEDAPSLWSRV
ncbi:alpha-lytic protease prodomain-containing protein [Streptomyces albus]|uniref:carbohydrate-binding protein n=1 Tax=Streptomyces albus TaxID=1888 RepID=UPI0024ACF9EF|nr:carbohydrate-binding protein [Streptomyces albus]MDI6413478.1 alpha-lytic protease prodomain-containing protein [Streptomyces albus]